ncbi:MAG: hypothetical protein ACK5GL_07540 [Bacteroidota bacterium]
MKHRRHRLRSSRGSNYDAGSQTWDHVSNPYTKRGQSRTSK